MSDFSNCAVSGSTFTERKKNVQVFEEDSGGNSGQESARGGDVRQGHFQHAGRPGAV